MVKIEDSSPKSISGSYSRLFGDDDLGYLISKVQSASIRAGNELERIITEKARSIVSINGVDNLDDFLKIEIIPNGSFIATKLQIRKSEKIKFEGAEPDFMVFQRKNNQQKCRIIELKDGDAFDTKKAAGEHSSLEDFISRNARNISYETSLHICCFNQDSRDAIVKGFKNKITPEMAMTGREFCTLLFLDYEEIVEIRQEHQAENIYYFISQIIILQEEAIRQILSNKNS